MLVRLCRLLSQVPRPDADRARHRVVVGAERIDPAQRDVAGPVLRNPRAGFANVIGANEEVPLGAYTTYRCHLTNAEIAAFRAASNCRFVEPDRADTADEVTVSQQVHLGDAEVGLPERDVLEYMGCRPDTDSYFTGRDVLIAVLDGGTTAAVRERMGWRVVGERNFTDTQPGTDGITTDHGCMVAPCAVPPGGRIYDAIISNNEGSAYWSDSAAAMRAAADAGARIINYSYSGDSDSDTLRDAARYLADRGVQLFCSAGNAGRLGYIGSPARLSREFSNVHSSGAFDHRTNNRADFSNCDEDLSGVAPGARVLTLDPQGNTWRVNGTSFSSPYKAYLCARICTGGRHSASEAGRALKTSAQDTPEPLREEGGGRYDLHAALSKLGVFDPDPEPTPEPEPTTPPPSELEPEPVPDPEPPELTWWEQLLIALRRSWGMSCPASNRERRP